MRFEQQAQAPSKSIWAGILLNCVLFGAASFYVGKFRQGMIKLVLFYAATFSYMSVSGPLGQLISANTSWTENDVVVAFLIIWAIILTILMPLDGYRAVNTYNQQQRQAQP